MMVVDTTPDLIELLKSGGSFGILIVIVVTGLREDWVPGKTHRRVVDERDKALSIIQSNADATARALEVALEIRKDAR